ncbi:MAG: hypothetical protein QNI86_15335 [Halieaceae bacterium]|nr:hypothetical protein [Halieaceae bacterium]
MSVLKKVAVPVIAVLVFFAVKAFLSSTINGPESGADSVALDEEVLMAEVAESGIDASVGKQVIAASRALQSDAQKVATLEEAYGDAPEGSIKELRLYLDKHPTRKAQVGYALVNMIEATMDLPIQLDEYTSMTGLHYNESAESVVYHYTFADEFLAQYSGRYVELNQALEQLNPDAACKLSLQLLGQGFDMTYSYRNSSDEELFTVVRTYEGCEQLGFTEHS